MLRNAAAVAAMTIFLPAVASACASGAKCISVGGASLVSASVDLRSEETGARWLKAPEPIAPTVDFTAAAQGDPLTISPIYEPGDVLPKGRYSMLMNSAYFGLPPAPEGTLYFEVDLKVLLVDRDSYEILQDVSQDVAATF